MHDSSEAWPGAFDSWVHVVTCITSKEHCRIQKCYHLHKWYMCIEVSGRGSCDVFKCVVGSVQIELIQRGFKKKKTLF